MRSGAVADTPHRFVDWPGHHREGCAVLPVLLKVPSRRLRAPRPSRPEVVMAIESFDEAMTELNSAGIGFSTTVETIDGAVGAVGAVVAAVQILHERERRPCGEHAAKQTATCLTVKRNAVCAWLPHESRASQRPGVRGWHPAPPRWLRWTTGGYAASIGSIITSRCSTSREASTIIATRNAVGR